MEVNMKFSTVHGILLLAIMLFSNCIASEINKSSIIIFNSSEKHYMNLVKGIDDESENSFIVTSFPINKKTNVDFFKDKTDQIKPDFIILIGNKASVLYYHFQSRYDPDIPAIIVSSAFVDQLITHMKNTLAIRNETPLPILVGRARTHINTKINKVGVLYRSWMSQFIEHNQELGKLEDVTLVKYEIDNKSNIRSINYYFKKMLKDDIDAVWVIDDSYIMTSKNIKTSIKPLLDKFNKPIISNSNTFVKPELSLSIFSVMPDQYSLGVQSVEIIKDMIDKSSEKNIPINDLIKNRGKLIEPISTIESINLQLLKKKHIGVIYKSLDEIEIIYKNKH